MGPMSNPCTVSPHASIALARPLARKTARPSSAALCNHTGSMVSTPTQSHQPWNLPVSSARSQRLSTAVNSVSTGGKPAGSRPAAGRKPGSKGRRKKAEDVQNEPDKDEDVEIYNLETGWTVEALKEGLGNWNVSALTGGSTLEDDDETEGGASASYGSNDEDDGLDDITSWSTSNFAVREVTEEQELWSVEVPDDDDQWDNDPHDDIDLDDDGVEAAKAAAERALLSSIPEHVMKELRAHAAQAKLEAEQLNPNALRAAAKRRKTHQRLRILSGSAAGCRLKSAQGDQTRPMMEMVRGAVFSMIQSQLGCGNCLPEGTRWLDLFAGTGAIGIEAVSRGCSAAHFVELDPWVCRTILEPNLEAADVDDVSVVHTMKAEQFLRTARLTNTFAGGAFDFISVCPPYLLVDYNELFDLLEASPLVSETTIILVEYPKRLADLVRDRLGPLEKIKDRKYGRTMLAIYGPGAIEE